MLEYLGKPLLLERLLADPNPNFEYIRVVEGIRDNEARQAGYNCVVFIMWLLSGDFISSSA